VPPGHNKGGDPQPRPCGNGNGHEGGDPVGGPIVVLPLAVVGTVLGWSRRMASSGRRRVWLRTGGRTR
jgi:hypothetical protein